MHRSADWIRIIPNKETPIDLDQIKKGIEAVFEGKLPPEQLKSELTPFHIDGDYVNFHSMVPAKIRSMGGNNELLRQQKLE
ncbi:predicted protein [Sclerotinia sclerotiorum 1980 UF-70]|uniref:Uncharacterized protein n=1 Tax=Sclerotinia sclerotiorum (strain ATCC 18683 / 1980 / Ss-1) TaxID=665079 RepID=A7ESU1_SCLS1|nr:predicted protein [Sclerotinia sclerotiorum 1980 UF-70]EDN92533.1 predicted protein [Sclerotinia sclerotiorum 1980 UF-70]